MKKFLSFILCISLLVSIASSVIVYAEPPIIRRMDFECADEVRRFILATKESKEEYEEKNEGWGYYETAKEVSEKIEKLPFVTVSDSAQVDYSRFIYEYRIDSFNEIWRMQYRINGVLYSFEYRFHATSAGSYYDKPCIEVNLEGYNHKIRLYEEDQSLKGSFWCEEVPLYVTVSTLNEEDVDFSAFNLGALSLELDADRTTAATTDVTENITTTLQTSAVDEKTQDNEKNALDNALIIVGVVLLTAALSSLVTAVIINKRRRSKD